LSLKPLEFIGSCQDDLSEMPDDVKSEAGYAFFSPKRARSTRTPSLSKGLRGRAFKKWLSTTRETTYRAVYTVGFKHAVYALHVFKKKAKKGIATPKSDIDMIERRPVAAAEHHRETYEKPKERRKR
jgi:phage-related protein